jgi:hypothetical protein
MEVDSDGLPHDPTGKCGTKVKGSLSRSLRSKPVRSYTTDLHKILRRRVPRITFLSHRIVHHDVVNYFADNCERVLESWVALLAQTCLPKGTPSTDPRVLEGFKAIDSVIAARNITPLLSRLGYVRLLQLFQSLETIIKLERKDGLLQGSPGYRDASIAMDMYHLAQGSLSRKMLLERKRAARRWTILAGRSPLFLLVYSGSAESTMYVLHRDL